VGGRRVRKKDGCRESLLHDGEALWHSYRVAMAVAYHLYQSLAVPRYRTADMSLMMLGFVVPLIVSEIVETFETRTERRDATQVI